MNQLQIVEVLKGLLVAGGPVVVLLVNIFGMETGGAEKIVQALAALVSVAGIVWMALGKSNTSLARDAASVPGLQVHVDPLAAPQSVINVSNDPKARDVLPMIGGPRTDDGKLG